MKDAKGVDSEKARNCMTCESLLVKDYGFFCSQDGIAVNESCFCTGWNQYLFGVQNDLDRRIQVQNRLRDITKPD